jgi:hypothetical protein
MTVRSTGGCSLTRNCATRICPAGISFQSFGASQCSLVFAADPPPDGSATAITGAVVGGGSFGAV